MPTFRDRKFLANKLSIPAPYDTVICPVNRHVSGSFPFARSLIGIGLGLPTSQTRSSETLSNEVVAQFSGALITDIDDKPIIEGVEGFGDNFTLGRTGPSELDTRLLSELEVLHKQLIGYIGSVRAEWAFDGKSRRLSPLQHRPFVLRAVRRKLDSATSAERG